MSCLSLVGTTITDAHQLESDEDVRSIIIATMCMCIILIAFFVMIAATLIIAQLLRKRRARKKFLTLLHANSRPQYHLNTGVKEYKGTLKVMEHKRQNLADSPGCVPNDEKTLQKVEPECAAQEVHDYDHIQPKNASPKAPEVKTNACCTVPTPEDPRHGMKSTRSHIPSNSNKLTISRKVASTPQNTLDHSHETENVSMTDRAMPHSVHSDTARGEVSTEESAQRVSTHDYEIESWIIPTDSSSSERQANATPWSVKSLSSTVTQSGLLRRGNTTKQQGIHSASTRGSVIPAQASAQQASTQDYENDDWTCFQGQGNTRITPVTSSGNGKLGNKVDKHGQADTVIRRSKTRGTAHHSCSTGTSTSALTKSTEIIADHIYSTIPENQISAQGCQEINGSTKSLETMLRELEEECGIANVVFTEENEAYGTTASVRNKSHITNSVDGCQVKGICSEMETSAHSRHGVESQEYDYILV